MQSSVVNRLPIRLKRRRHDSFEMHHIHAMRIAASPSTYRKLEYNTHMNTSTLYSLHKSRYPHNGMIVQFACIIIVHT